MLEQQSVARRRPEVFNDGWKRSDAVDFTYQLVRNPKTTAKWTGGRNVGATTLRAEKTKMDRLCRFRMVLQMSKEAWLGVLSGTMDDHIVVQ